VIFFDPDLVITTDVADVASQFSDELLHADTRALVRVKELGLQPPKKASQAALSGVHPFRGMDRFAAELLLLRSDNSVVLSTREQTQLVHIYRMQQKFTSPYSPYQNGMVELVIRALRSGVQTAVALSPSNMPVVSLATGSPFTITNGHVRH